MKPVLLPLFPLSAAACLALAASVMAQPGPVTVPDPSAPATRVSRPDEAILNPQNLILAPEAEFSPEEVAEREAAVRGIQEREQAREARAAAWLAAQPEEERARLREGRVRVSDVVDGHPVFESASNLDAAISTNASAVRGVARYESVRGAPITIGVWESGTGQIFHPEWNDRMTWMESATGTPSNHAAHVTGTLIASGATSWRDSADALGMAPAASVQLFDSATDLTEMLNAGADLASGFATGKLALSNHSYGQFAAWDSRWVRTSASVPRWYGPVWGPGVQEDLQFGRYSQRSADLDDACRVRFRLLPFFSAGNFRSDRAPAEGASVQYSNGTSWVSANYTGASDPPGVAAVENGFDCLSEAATAKNVMTVGAINDALLDFSSLPPPLTGGKVRSPSTATMSTFSAWGPTDDGRVKPDIVANGVSVYSTVNSGSDGSALSSSDYGYSSGTSMASPNACGSAALVLDFYRRKFPIAVPRASTMKGLIIHTADDLGNPGPDYRFGWGLMNTAAAADLIQRQADEPANDYLFENQLTSTTPQVSTFYWNEREPIRLTLCYTDLPGAVKTTLDDRSPDLVNDVDIDLSGPGNAIGRPYLLDPVNPDAVATTGDNDVDNVKQIYVEDPVPGQWTQTVRIDGALTGSSQVYSLIRSGISTTPPVVVPQRVTTVRSYAQDFESGRPLSADGWTYFSPTNGRTRVVDGALLMDEPNEIGLLTVNTATLHCNLSDFTAASALTLEVDWQKRGDETHTLPGVHNGLGEGDGISVSADGVTWYRVANLHAIANNIQQSLVLDLSTVMPTLGIGYTEDFQIRFTQYDNAPAPTDGIQLDAVRLYHRTPGQFVVTWPLIEEDESTGSVLIRVDRRQGSDGAATVSYFTRPLTAVPGTDYTSKTGTLTFADGQLNASFLVDLRTNFAAHGPRVFEVVLSAPTGGTTLGTPKTSQVVIVDSDESSTLRTDPVQLRPTVVKGRNSAVQTLRLWNSNGYGAKQFAATTSTPWITVKGVEPGDAARPALITLSYDFTGMDCGRYAGSVQVAQVTAPAASRDIPVILTIGYAGATRMASVSPGTVDVPVDGPVALAGPASVYPLSLTVPDGGRVGEVTLGFTGLSHSNPADLDIVLQAPGGQTAQVLSDTAQSDAGTPLEIADYLTDTAPFGIPHRLTESLTGPRQPTSRETGDFDVMPTPAPQTPGRKMADLTGAAVTGTWKAWINDDAEGNGGSLTGAWLSIETVELSDGMYETLKSSEPFALAGQSLLFTPEDSPDGYLAGRCSAGGLPGGSPGPEVKPDTDGYATVTLTGGKSVAFYGQRYTSLGIGENGDIVFGKPPGSSGTLSVNNFLALPRLAGLFGDLGGGAIHFQQLTDRVVATWAKVKEGSTGAQVTFRVEVFFDGRIRMTWDPGDPVTGLVGLSRGMGSGTWATTPGFSTLPEPPLEIRSFALNPLGECKVIWSSIPEFGYSLEWSDNLQTWKPVSGTTAGEPGEVTGQIFQDPSTSGKLFLRVRKTGTFGP